MSANRRRHINALPGLKLFMGFVVGAMLLLAGLGYVYCQNRLHRLVGEIGKLEKELGRLQTMQAVVDVSISRLSSPQELRKRLANGFFRLEEIRDEHLFMIGAPAGSRPEAKELRPVSNSKAAR